MEPPKMAFSLMKLFFGPPKDLFAGEWEERERERGGGL